MYSIYVLETCNAEKGCNNPIFVFQLCSAPLTLKRKKIMNEATTEHRTNPLFS